MSSAPSLSVLSDVALPCRISAEGVRAAAGQPAPLTWPTPERSGHLGDNHKHPEHSLESADEAIALMNGVHTSHLPQRPLFPRLVALFRPSCRHLLQTQSLRGHSQLKGASNSHS